ncbi:hypothetical protein VTG60DRAFT_5362 [Thermothelomyces hinnuleus]
MGLWKGSTEGRNFGVCRPRAERQKDVEARQTVWDQFWTLFRDSPGREAVFSSYSGLVWSPTNQVDATGAQASSSSGFNAIP